MPAMGESDRVAGDAAELTDRESQVLDLVVYGLTNEEVATRLAISRRTVEAHVRTLFHKLGVRRRAQLAALYHQPNSKISLGTPTSAPRDARDGQVLPGTMPLLRRSPVDHERQVRLYAAAVHGLIDRQFSLFEERVEITLIIGERDGQDAVIERRWTTPGPYLVYRVLSPIIATSIDGPSIQLDDLEFACSVNGQDTQADVHPVWDVTARPLVIILFKPGIKGETEWVLRYRAPQLWDPLRRTGEDTLTWATATLEGERHRPTINELTLKVIFPVSWTEGQIAERNNFGVVQPNDQHQVTWHHDAPGAGAYHWVLQGSPSTKPGSTD